MRNLDKVILGLLVLFSAFVSIMFFWGAVGTSPLWAWLRDVERSSLDSTLLAVIFAALAVYLGFMVWKNTEPQGALAHSTALGQVRINYTTIKELVVRAALGVEGIKDAVVDLSGEEALAVVLRVHLAPDHHIPTVTASVQSEVKAYMYETVGVEPVNIEVEVLGTMEPGRARVQ